MTSDDDLVAVDAATAATRPLVAGPILGWYVDVADGHAYYAAVGPDTPCDAGRMHRVPLAGGAAESGREAPGVHEGVGAANGTAAFVAVRPVVRDLTTGREEVWLGRKRPSPLLHGPVVELAWSLDGRRLALTARAMPWTTHVLDLAAADSLDGAAPLQVDGVPSPQSPAWASDRHLAVTSESSMTSLRLPFVVDLSTNEARPLPEPNGRVGDLDYDATGQFLVAVIEDAHLVVHDGSGRRLIGQGFVHAAW